jgi:hypothetical protein
VSAGYENPAFLGRERKRASPQAAGQRPAGAGRVSNLLPERWGVKIRGAIFLNYVHYLLFVMSLIEDNVGRKLHVG